MTANRTGPERERPGPTPETGPVQKSAGTTQTDQPKTTTQPRLCGAAAVAQLYRRRQVTYRLASLDCGCRDPWPCHCAEPPLSERAIDGWVAAAQHIISIGEIPLLPLEVLQRLWRRGGAGRLLAVELHELCGQAVA